VYRVIVLIYFRNIYRVRTVGSFYYLIQLSFYKCYLFLVPCFVLIFRVSSLIYLTYRVIVSPRQKEAAIFPVKGISQSYFYLFTFVFCFLPFYITFIFWFFKVLKSVIFFNYLLSWKQNNQEGSF
jgi:hypothetical protein